MKLLVTTLSKRSHKSVHAATAAPPPATRRTTAKLPATATKATAAAPKTTPKATPGVLVKVIETLLKPCHKHELLKNLSSDLIQQSKQNLGVRFYVVDLMPIGVQALLNLFPGSGREAKGSRAILGREVEKPIVLLVWSEFEQVANELGISVDSVAEAFVMHEVGHCAGSAIYLHTSEPDASFLSEQFGWSYGSDLHRRFGRSTAAEFQKVAAHCLKSHEK